MKSPPVPLTVAQLALAILQARTAAAQAQAAAVAAAATVAQLEALQGALSQQTLADPMMQRILQAGSAFAPPVTTHFTHARGGSDGEGENQVKSSRPGSRSRR